MEIDQIREDFAEELAALASIEAKIAIKAEQALEDAKTEFFEDATIQFLVDIEGNATIECRSDDSENPNTVEIPFTEFVDMIVAIEDYSREEMIMIAKLFQSSADRLIAASQERK